MPVYSKSSPTEFTEADFQEPVNRIAALIVEPRYRNPKELFAICFIVPAKWFISEDIEARVSALPKKSII